jgi:uncharacterized protein with von Willebrand factor type A (vWA) domain
VVVDTTLTPGYLPAVLLRFVHRLRRAGIPVSMVETLDAVDAIRRVDLADREQFRGALRSTLIKRVEHHDTFNSLFDIYFAILRDDLSAAELTTSLDRPEQESSAGGGPVALESTAEMVDGEEEPSTELLALLLRALRSGDEGALRALAGLAVERFAGLTSEGASSER